MKQKVLVDVVVWCDFHEHIPAPRRFATLEDYAKHLEELCKETKEIVNEHRSATPISLWVERKYEWQCEHCGHEWETDDDGTPLCCAKAQEEYEMFKKSLDEEPTEA